MSLKVVLKPRAVKDFRKLPSREAARIDTAIDALAAGREGLDIRSVIGQGDLKRLRVGRYRVLFYHLEDEDVLLIDRVVIRSESTFRFGLLF